MPEDVARGAAEVVADQLRRKPASVFALPTSRTPRLLYHELAQRCRAGELSFKAATVFALDEYHGLPTGHPDSFRRYFEQYLLREVDLPSGAFHIAPSDSADPSAAATAYENAIARHGGIDLAVLGIGANGHIAFNEPGSPLDGHTWLVELAPETLAAMEFQLRPGERAPRQAITMGIATILAARRVILLATGTDKARVVKEALQGPVVPALPASALQRHAHCEFLIDQDAAQLLSAAPVARDTAAGHGG